MKVFIGIDPGLGGALAALDENGKILALEDAPILTVVKATGKEKRDYAIPLMVKMCDRFRDKDGMDRGQSVRVGLEQVQAMPKQGVTSTCMTCRGLALWEGILTALEISYTKILPQRWKKWALFGMGKEKDASRLRAMQLFPSAELHLKKHHGRADALLIAEYMRLAHN